MLQLHQHFMGQMSVSNGNDSRAVFYDKISYSTYPLMNCYIFLPFSASCTTLLNLF